MYAILGTDTKTFENKPLPLIDQLTKERVAKQCDTLNFRHKNAQLCGRKSTALHTYLYFKRHGVQESWATVTKVEKQHLGTPNDGEKREFVWVSIPRFGIEERLRVGDYVEGCGWTVAERIEGGEKATELVLKRKDGAEERRVFETVRVRIEANDPRFRNQTTLTIL